MGRFLLACRAFWRVLVDGMVAERVKPALEPPPAVEAPRAEPKPPRVEKPAAKPARSEALTLLATLQREARFVDFVKEPLEGYADAQIGAAARDIHRDCGKVIDRLFALRPVLAESEGAEVAVPSDLDASRIRLTGKITDQPRSRGRLVHHGWEATACEMPVWTGSDGAARVVTPAEIEVQ